MAWIKVPAEHHPLFLAAVPKDRRVTTIRMFGGTAALINGHIFAGLFARSAIVRLSPDDQRIALALEGAGSAKLAKPRATATPTPASLKAARPAKPATPRATATPKPASSSGRRGGSLK